MPERKEGKSRRETRCSSSYNSVEVVRLKFGDADFATARSLGRAVAAVSS